MSLKKGINDLYVILTDQNGIINQVLERDNSVYYDGVGDIVTMMECMADDVARVWRLVEWHDELAEIDTDTWKFIETDDPNDLELRFKETDWLICLKERIDTELTKRELDDKTKKPLDDEIKKQLNEEIKKYGSW